MTTAPAALGRVEATRLVRNPVVWLGFGMTALWLHAAVRTGDPEDQYNFLIGCALVIPGMFMLFHTGLAVLRARTHATEELFETVPVGRDRRTLGHGLSTIAAGALGALLIAIAIGLFLPTSPMGQARYLRAIDPVRWASVDVPRPSIAQLLQGPLAVVAICCLAISLVRWIPSWTVLLVFVFLALMQFTFLGLWYGSATSGFEWLLLMPVGLVQDGWYGNCNDPADYCDLVVSGFDQVTPWWHAAYLVALAAFFVSIAVLRHRRDRTTWWAFGAITLAVVALGVAQVAVFQDYELPVPP